MSSRLPRAGESTGGVDVGYIKNRGTTRRPNYWLRLWQGGKRVEVAAKTASGARAHTRAEAEAILRVLERAAIEGELGAVLPRRGRGLSLGELRDRFVEAGRATVKDAGEYARDTRNLLGHAVKRFGEGRAVDSLTVRDLEAWRDDMLAHGHKRQTIANRLHRLSVALRWAMRERLVTRRDLPTRSVELPPARRLGEPLRPEDYFTPADAGAMLAWLAAPERTAWAPVVAAALLSGARLGELRKLTWRDVDLARGSLLLRQTKNSRDRQVPIGEDLRAILAAWRARPWHSDDSLVFAEGDRVPDGKVQWERLQAACDGCGLRRRPFHALRHSYASALAERGVNLLTISRLLGHGSVLVTGRYSHVADADLRAAVSTLRFDAPSPAPKPKRPKRARKPKLRLVS
ncbi:MAG: site-specific integrase [Deltaproteobacteria bacterium]|nr:site-specific integrase [Deltaproteobacteria bacterium]